MSLVRRIYLYIVIGLNIINYVLNNLLVCQFIRPEFFVVVFFFVLPTLPTQCFENWKNKSFVFQFYFLFRSYSGWYSTRFKLYVFVCLTFSTAARSITIPPVTAPGEILLFCHFTRELSDSDELSITPLTLDMIPQVPVSISYYRDLFCPICDTCSFEERH